MITNIFLGLILVIIIISFVILNNKINIVQDCLGTIIRKLNGIETHIINNKNLIEHLSDRFNKRILVDNEYFEIINSSINDKFRALNYNDDYIKERLNTIDSDTQNLIIAEHRCTRNEIKKKAKISSKLKSQSKTNNNTNKQ